MSTVTGSMEGNKLKLNLSGEIDSANAGETGLQIDKLFEAGRPSKIEINCGDLTYISSAGLRVLLNLRKQCPDMILENVGSDVYEIFDMTGFTEMMTVRRAQRTISVEGCEVLGSGFNGEVCRIAPDTIVKVYFDKNGLEKIHRELKLSRKAFVLGIPTAIPYDIVKIKEGGYGAVFELIDARTYADAFRKGEPPLDELIRESVDLLRLIHSTRTRDELIPDMRKTASAWANDAKEYLDAPLYEKLKLMMDAMPEDRHLLHGDFHFKNIMLQGKESVLIDMDHLCCGSPVFELANMFTAYCGYREISPEESMEFFGMPLEVTSRIWEKSEALYLKDKTPEEAERIGKQIRLLGYAHELARNIRRPGIEPEERKKRIRHFAEKLADLIPQVERLEF